MGEGIFFGLTTVDVVNYVDSFPGFNEKVKAEGRLYLAGGPAANAAITYSALKNKSTLISVLGKHPVADIARKDLYTFNVSFVEMAPMKKAEPVLSTVTVDCSTGNRSVIYSAPEISCFLERIYSKVVDLENAAVIMFDGHYLNAADELLNAAKSKGVPVVVDCGSWKDGMEKLLQRADYVICSADFVPPGVTEQKKIPQYFESFGVKHFGISRGGDTIRAFSDGSSAEIPVPHVEVVDTLGAGDVLHGAFCHYINKYDFFKSLEMAVCVASESCTRRGPRV